LEYAFRKINLSLYHIYDYGFRLVALSLFKAPSVIPELCTPEEFRLLPTEHDLLGQIQFETKRKTVSHSGKTKPHPDRVRAQKWQMTARLVNGPGLSSFQEVFFQSSFRLELAPIAELYRLYQGSESKCVGREGLWRTLERPLIAFLVRQ
jgi:hypothetical protein